MLIAKVNLVKQVMISKVILLMCMDFIQKVRLEFRTVRMNGGSLKGKSVYIIFAFSQLVSRAAVEIMQFYGDLTEYIAQFRNIYKRQRSESRVTFYCEMWTKGTNFNLKQYMGN